MHIYLQKPRKSKRRTFLDQQYDRFSSRSSDITTPSQRGFGQLPFHLPQTNPTPLPAYAVGAYQGAYTPTGVVNPNYDYSGWYGGGLYGNGQGGNGGRLDYGQRLWRHGAEYYYDSMDDYYNAYNNGAVGAGNNSIPPAYPSMVKKQPSFYEGMLANGQQPAELFSASRGSSSALLPRTNLRNSARMTVQGSRLSGGNYGDYNYR